MTETQKEILNELIKRGLEKEAVIPVMPALKKTLLKLSILTGSGRMIHQTEMSLCVVRLSFAEVFTGISV